MESAFNLMDITLFFIYQPLLELVYFTFPSEKSRIKFLVSWRKSWFEIIKYDTVKSLFKWKTTFTCYKILSQELLKISRVKKGCHVGENGSESNIKVVMIDEEKVFILDTSYSFVLLSLRYLQYSVRHKLLLVSFFRTTSQQHYLYLEVLHKQYASSIFRNQTSNKAKRFPQFPLAISAAFLNDFSMLLVTFNNFIRCSSISR